MLGYQQQPQLSRKRSRVEEFGVYDYQGIQELKEHASGDVPLELTPPGHHAQIQQGAVAYQYHLSEPVREQVQATQSLQQQTQQQQQHHHHHHHHRLPNQAPPSKYQRTGYAESSAAAQDQGAPSVVGQPGMPEPAPRPKGPKLKFTPEDDALLVSLKETKDLTWKQIADFFPGRSSGTLQVRYCTKLKAKTTAWTDEMVRDDSTQSRE